MLRRRRAREDELIRLLARTRAQLLEAQDELAERKARSRRRRKSRSWQRPKHNDPW